ncbi:DivIVA domain-containing protein [Intrasporangium sp.]|uniref:DivIVA domain-containing protein n=1 Tax=Intrasporangium sp. TaxID=1925024 RepID=UPI00322199DC
MKWLFLLVGIVVLCGVAALLLGYVGGGMGRATSTLSHEPLPDDELTDADLENLRFDVAVRGYRMSEVDAVIGRLRRELKEKDEQLGVLLADAPGATGPVPSGPSTTPPGSSVEVDPPDPTRPTADHPWERDPSGGDAPSGGGAGTMGDAPPGGGAGTMGDAPSGGGGAPPLRAAEPLRGAEPRQHPRAE